MNYKAVHTHKRLRKKVLNDVGAQKSMFESKDTLHTSSFYVIVDKLKTGKNEGTGV